METDKELELLYEKNYINRRLYKPRLMFSDGFKATIMKEFKDKDCDVDRFVRAINFLINKELEESKDKTDKPEFKNKPMSSGIKLPEKEIEPSVPMAQKEQL